MDVQRLILFFVFSFSLMVLWAEWERQKHPVPSDIQETKEPPVSATSVPRTPSAATATAQRSPTFKGKGKTIVVTTDTLRAELNTAGGNLQRVDLLNHLDAEDKNQPFSLLQDNGRTYLAQAGLLGGGLPDHNASYLADKEVFGLAEGADRLEVRLLAADTPNFRVAKVYTFHRGSHLVDVAFEIENNSKEPLTSSAYFQFVRDDSVAAGESSLVPTYTGPAVYTEADKLRKIGFPDIEKNKVTLPARSDNGWIGMLQHYFVAAWLPVGNDPREFYVRKLDTNLYSAGVLLPVADIAPGQHGRISTRLYMGPAQSKLDEIAPGLGLSVDYGWLTMFAVPLFWAMSLFNDWTGNWGIAIILLTILIKLAFFPLSAASYRSMAKMRNIAPRLEQIKKQCGDDRERLNKAMLELYKTEKINPLGGCLPILIQIPIFIALYWAILSSVELRHAPFFGWITDLSSADPYFVLPIIMGISMLIQTRLNPVPPDPLQARLMQVMPIVFSIVFFFLPAGLVLYSVVNNLLSIGQQWFITRSERPARKGGAKV